MKPDWKKIHKTLLVILVVVSMIEAGNLRGHCIVNLSGNGQAIFLPRIGTRPIDRPNTLNLLEQILSNPKWTSTFFYTALFWLLTLLLVWILFRNTSYLKWTTWLYLLLSVVCLMAILGGVVFHLPRTGYFIADNIKEWMASPFVAMLLVPALLLHQGLESLEESSDA
jgi:hypothetical protein